MPAPNIATLYDFESAYEDALRNLQSYFTQMMRVAAAKAQGVAA